MSISFTTMRTLPTTKEGERVNLTYSPLDHVVSASVIDRFGRGSPVPPEQMPREFRKIRSEWAFHTLLNQVYVRAPKTSDGTSFLYVEPKLKGGGGGDSIIDIEDPDLPTQIMSIVDPGLKELSEKDIRENVILLVGRTGSGKSTLGNLLLGCELSGEQVGFAFKFKTVNPIFPFSHSNVSSCTACPNVHTPKGMTKTYIDLPGWDDANGVAQDIANGFFRREVLKNARYLRIILVVDYVDIEKRGTYLRETVDNLLQFLGLSDTKDAQKLQRLADSMLLVISHAPNIPNMEDAAVLKAVTELLTNYTIASELSANGKEILRRIRDNTKWSFFSVPNSSGLSTKASTEQAKISKQLKEIAPIDKANLDLQIQVSSKYAGKIQASLIYMITSLRRSFSTKIVETIGKGLTDFYTGMEGEAALKAFQARYQALIDAREPKSLFELLSDLSFRKGMFGSEFLNEAREKDKCMRFLADLLPKREADLIPCRRDWLKEFDIREQLQVWNQLLIKMTVEAALTLVKLPPDKLTPDKKKNKIVLQGYFPKTSQITQQLEDFTDIVEIEIHALHTITIDEDLTGLAGVHVTIIAPKWEIRHKRTINLTGAACKYTYPTPAAAGVGPSGSGSNGDPGLPGSNGGHFFGIGLACSEVAKLTVISNGGKGGKGQQGGQGRDGANGADGLAKIDFCTTERGALDEPTAKSRGWDYVQWPPFRHGDSNKYDMELRNNGKDGGEGGHGGMGGAGGLGGRAGSIEFLSVLDPNANIVFKAGDGVQGKPGAAGGVGIGGRRGRDWRGKWHLGGNPDCGWNGWHLPRHEGEPGTGPKSADGTAPAKKNADGIQDPAPLIPFDALDHLHRYRTFAITESNLIVMEAMEIFRQKYDSHPKVQEKANVDRFIDECEKMERFYTALPDKKKALPLYRWMLERIQTFDRSGCNPSQSVLLQCLHTSTLSKILQIQASMESRLIIDIKSFLAQIEANIKALERLDHNILIAAYEKGYVDQINSKIKEADLFIQKLSEDIRAADKEIAEQIQKLLAEITTLEGSLNGKQGEISAKRQKLKEMIERRKIFGVLTIAVQAIGCCFPPAGPIVAGVASAGLAVLNNPDSAPLLAGQVLNAYLEGVGTRGTDGQIQFTKIGDVALARVRAMTLLNAAVQAVNPASGSEEAQLKAMDQAIHNIEEQRKQLNAFKGQVTGSFTKSLHAIVDQAEKVQKALQGKTKIALDFSRLAAKRAFENLKVQMKEATKAFATGEGFLNTIQQMEDAIDTSAKIYEHVEEYREKRQLAQFIARLAAPTVTDDRIEKYKQQVQQNVVLEQYTRAVAAVKQWAFPFASLFINDFANLQSFTKAASADDFMRLVKQQISLLRNKVEARYSEIDGRIDTFLWRGNFNKSVPNGPFCVWKYKEHGREIRDLLRGEQVVLFADVTRTSSQYSAIKFNQIELEIYAEDSELQEKLNEALEGKIVELQHSGISYYKHDDKIYQMANDKGFSIRYQYTCNGNGPYGANEVYNKMKTGNFMLSPFTRWFVKLKSEGPLNRPSELLDRLSEIELSKIKIHLNGSGQYIYTEKAREQELKIDGYEDSVFLSSANRASSSTNRVPVSAPSKTAAIPQEPVGLGINAAESRNDRNYLYQGTDVHAIVQSPQLRHDLRDFAFIQGMQSHHLARKVEEIIAIVNRGIPVLCVYNLSNVHWVTFAITRRTNGQLVVLYKDSLGSSTNTELFKLLKSRAHEFRSHPGTEQQGDGTSCGIFALQNMRIIANQLRSNREQFITNFEAYHFCTLERARELRRGDFADFYAAGVAAQERREKEQVTRAKELETAHRGEVDKIIRRLRRLAPRMTVQTARAATNATNTIVVQIEAAGDDFRDYHYRIAGTRDVSLRQLEDLMHCFLWYKEKDYRIENGIIKVFTKITLAG